MLDRRRGAIVNIASTNGPEFGMPGRAAYCAAKAGVVGLTRVLGVEWIGRGVRVNAVEPGYVNTPLIAKAMADGLLDERELLDRIPAQRLASPEDVARAVALLASEETAYVVGQTLVVDGGQLAYGAAAPVTRIPGVR
jgi:NAD(P)-dependent dehydrogenase (short-subunit alcohol dehydrogenase family)